MESFITDKSRELITINLDDILGDGGQGKICNIKDRDHQVAKIYNQLTSAQIEKLKVMVDNPPEDVMLEQGYVSIAWPQDLIKNDQGEYIGFLMPKIKDSMTLLNVYNPQHRKEKAPWFNWLLLHITAQNVATVIEHIHDKNYIVGDIKPQNFLVNPRAIVSIVDTDSFQIRHPQTGKIYRCPVGSEEYTPPEIYGKNFQTIDRLETHDRFGLGVIIYHLLFGNHPHQGKWNGDGEPPSLDERISKGHWPHAPQSPVITNSFSIPLEIVHPRIQNCFHRCFTTGHDNPHLRPSAKEWREALAIAINDLTDCGIEVGHQYAKSYGKCYWCERKNQIRVDIFSTDSNDSKHSKCTVAALKSILEAVEIQTSLKPKVFNNQDLNKQTITVIHDDSLQEVEIQTSTKPKVVNNKNLNKQTVTVIHNDSSQQTDNEYSTHNLEIHNNNHKKQQVKQNSPVTTWISVIFIIISSLIVVPQLRESVTIPILRTLTGANK